MIDGFDPVDYPSDDEADDEDAWRPGPAEDDAAGDGSDRVMYDFRPHLEDPD